MQKVLIITSGPDRYEKLRSMIEGDLRFQIHAAFDRQEIRSQLESKVFNLAIIDGEIVDSRTLDTCNILRELDFGFSIIMIGKRVEHDVFIRIYASNDLHLLIQPTEKALAGLVRKLMSSRRVPKQLYPRFNTNQIAEIETLQDGENLLTSMYNLSKGGAYCEFDSPMPVTIGDMIRVRVQLADINSEYALNAKVVWTTAKGRFSGRFGCGFKFISTQDTYRTLLSKA